MQNWEGATSVWLKVGNVTDTSGAVAAVLRSATQNNRSISPNREVGCFRLNHELLAKSGGFQPELVARSSVCANIGDPARMSPIVTLTYAVNGIARFFANYSTDHQIGF